MPQMSPMPWMMILLFTLVTLTLINSYIFFMTSKNYKINSKIKPSNFLIKW